MKDRNVQHPSRYIDLNTEQVFNFQPAPGVITEEGTAINKANILPASLAEHYGWNDATENPTLADVLGALIPSGVVWMWSGTTPPRGWALCDGQNGRPDLRGKFIVGAGGSYSIGATGGKDTHALTVSEMPTHSHVTTADTHGGHQHRIQTGSNYGAAPSNYVRRDQNGWDTDFTSLTDSAGAHTHTITVNDTGEGVAHENRPPYYALAYIIKV